MLYKIKSKILFTLRLYFEDAPKVLCTKSVVRQGVPCVLVSLLVVL
jgi:hypothetical protein